MAQRGRSRKQIIEKELSNETYLDKVSSEIQTNQSKLSLVLGALIILVIGILIYNYFNKNKPDLGPSQQTEITQEDISPDKLPGKYTVKEGDTLFTIAENYYQDGSKFEEIAKANNITDVDSIVTGQILELPKLADVSLTPSADSAITQNEWGPEITGNTYTVQEGDWLYTIAGRAYGDINAYQKLIEANNISNPDLLYPGTVLNIPR